MRSHLFGVQRRLFSTSPPVQSDFAHCIIGGGVVGLAIAARLASRTNAPTVLIERHEECGTETSARNSEVIHAGIYYPETSLKTSLCIRGKELLYKLCEKHSIPHQKLGKWIIAQDDKQRDILQGLHDKNKRLGVPLEFLSKGEAERLEPDVHAPGGVLNSPTTGIISSHDLMTYLRGHFEDSGGDVSVLTKVTGIQKSSSGGYEISTLYGDDPETVTITADTVINSAGLGACDVSNMLLPQERHIKPYFCKGNYFSYSSSKPKVKRLIYPCPVEGLGGLGTHLTLDLAGRIRFGPDVEWVDDPNDLVARDHRLDAATNAVMQYLPNIDKAQLAADYSGIRPKLHPKGGPFQDFIIRKEDEFPGFINLLGIESPGLTSSLAIAEKVEELLYK